MTSNLMQPAFDSTPEFQHFKKIMRGVLAVPKKRLDSILEAAKENSRRNSGPHAPGRKPAVKRKRKPSAI